MSTLNIETPLYDSVNHERIRPVMTTGLDSSLELIHIIDAPKSAKNVGEIALGENGFIVGQPAKHGVDFLDLKANSSIEENLSDFSNEKSSMNQQELLAASFKRSVYDFATYLKDEKSYDIELDIIAERLAQTSNYFGSDKKVEAGVIEGSFVSIYRETNLMAKSNSDIPKQSLIDVGVHEMVHAASGTVFSVNEKLDQEISLEDQIEQSVVGLKRGDKFTWLNEGMTETVTQNILRRQGLGFSADEPIPYPNETSLISHIFSASDIPVNVFLEAYFEEPDLHSKTGERMPKWHKLQSSLTEAFGPKFLLKLEDEFKIDDPDSSYPYDQDKMLEFITPDKSGRTKIEAMREEWSQEKNKEIALA